MNLIKSIVMSMAMCSALSSAAFGAEAINGRCMDIKEPVAKLAVTPSINHNKKSPVKYPEGTLHTYESSCTFENNYTGGSQFDYGRVHNVYLNDENNEMYIGNLWMRDTYVLATFLDDDHEVLEFCSGQEVGDIASENGSEPLYFGCAVMNENGSLGLMDRIFADVDKDGNISVSDHLYFGTQYFIIYDGSGNVYSIEYRHKFWEIDPTVPEVPASAETDWYIYDWDYYGFYNENKQRVMSIAHDGDDVYVSGIVPHYEAAAKGTMKNGNIVIPLPQLIFINGGYTVRLMATKDGAELKNLILYYDSAKDAYTPANGVIVYGGSGLYPGYCDGMVNINLRHFKREAVQPVAPLDFEWSDAIDNYFTFRIDPKSVDGDEIYRGWMAVELYDDGQIHTFHSSDYNGNIYMDETRLAVRTSLLEVLDAANYVYWGDMSREHPNTFAILLPDGFSSDKLGIRLVYTVDGVESYSEIANVPVKGAYDPEVEGFTRTVLLEEFSTERCTNCPAAVQKLHDALDNMTDDEKAHVAVITHHAGFYTDQFTLPIDEELTWFYGGNYTYAPAFMADRTASGDDETPVFQSPTSWQLLRAKLQNAMKKKPGSTISIKGEIDGGMLYLSAEGEVDKSVKDRDNLRVTVYVLENNIASTLQAGASGEFIHDHVVRAYSDDAFGSKPAFVGDNWVMETALAIPSADIHNLEVVAFISNYNSSNRTDCKVLNASKVAMRQFGSTVVDEMMDGVVVETRWFDMNGREIVRPSEDGIYVKSIKYSDGVVKSFKVTL